MKKITLLLTTAWAALMFAGCDDFSTLPTYYTYVNGMDKIITITCYDDIAEKEPMIGGTYYYKYPEDATVTLSFTLAPREKYILFSNVSGSGFDNSPNPPFQALGIDVASLTISDGERTVVQNYDEYYSLFNIELYESNNTKKDAWLRYEITEKDFKEPGYPYPEQ